jgi:hypothetical protein
MCPEGFAAVAGVNRIPSEPTQIFQADALVDSGLGQTRPMVPDPGQFLLSGFFFFGIRLGFLDLGTLNDGLVLLLLVLVIGLNQRRENEHRQDRQHRSRHNGQEHVSDGRVPTTPCTFLGFQYPARGPLHLLLVVDKLTARDCPQALAQGTIIDRIRFNFTLCHEIS